MYFDYKKLGNLLTKWITKLFAAIKHAMFTMARQQRQCHHGPALWQ